MGKILCPVIFLLCFSFINAQDFRGGEFRIHTPEEEGSSFFYEVDLILYFHSDGESVPDSILTYHNSAFESFYVKLTEVRPLNKGINAYQYSFTMWTLGPSSSNFLNVVPNIEIIADNLVNTDSIQLITYFSTSLASSWPFNPNIAHWEDFSFDYYVDDNGDLRFQLTSVDEDSENGMAAYGNSFTIGQLFYAEQYEYLDSLFFNSSTGEVVWHNPPGPGRYLMGFDLLDIRPLTTTFANEFTRLLIIELTEEDFLVNSSEISLADQPNLKVSPNPAQNLLQIEYGGLAGAIQLQITNTQGQLVYEKKLESLARLQNQGIDVSNWPSGMYFVTIHTENGQVVKKVLVE